MSVSSWYPILANGVDSLRRVERTRDKITKGLKVTVFERCEHDAVEGFVGGSERVEDVFAAGVTLLNSASKAIRNHKHPVVEFAVYRNSVVSIQIGVLATLHAQHHLAKFYAMSKMGIMMSYAEHKRAQTWNDYIEQVKRIAGLPVDDAIEGTVKLIRELKFLSPADIFDVQVEEPHLKEEICYRLALET